MRFFGACLVLGPTMFYLMCFVGLAWPFLPLGIMGDLIGFGLMKLGS